MAHNSPCVHGAPISAARSQVAHDPPTFKVSQHKQPTGYRHACSCRRRTQKTTAQSQAPAHPACCSHVTAKHHSIEMKDTCAWLCTLERFVASICQLQQSCRSTTVTAGMREGYVKTHRRRLQRPVRRMLGRWGHHWTGTDRTPWWHGRRRRSWGNVQRLHSPNHNLETMHVENFKAWTCLTWLARCW